jgi:acetyl esterase/lipase
MSEKNGSVTLRTGDRIAGAIGRLLAGLPESLQRILAGRPTMIDGQVLDPELQLLLRLASRVEEPPLETLSITAVRQNLERQAAAFEGPKIAGVSVDSLQIPGPDGPIPARLYIPELEEPPLPLLVYLHGGGWVRGSLNTHDNPCRFLAREAGVLVLSVDYRLAPEHKFPAAVDDALAALRFAGDNAADLGADPTRIALGGDSAGGNLTAAVSQVALATGDRTPAFCLIIYPATDLTHKRRSYHLFSEGFFLTEEHMDWYRSHYLPHDDAARDPRASPLLARDLSGLPPAYVATAGFDVLRDEGEEYAARLRAAGVAVALRRHRGLTHGFINLVGMGHAGPAAMREVAGALRVGLITPERIAAR